VAETLPTDVVPLVDLNDQSRWRWSWLWAAFLVAASFLSYSTVLKHAEWIWDDDAYVLHQMTLREENGLKNIWLDPSTTPQYYPLVFTTFRMEFKSLNLENEFSTDFPAFRFHFNNILLFSLTVLLFWRVLQRLRIPGALLAVSLFAVHPVNVESVAWVTERKNILSGFLAMAAVLLFLRFMQIGNSDDLGKPTDDSNPNPRWGSFVAAMFCWCLALLAKTVIAFVPPALFLIIWWKRPKALFKIRTLVPLALLLIPGLIAGLHTAHLEVTQVGAGANFFPEIDGFMDRIMLAGKVVWVYAAHVVAPVQQMFFYPKWDPSPASIGQWVYLLGALALIFGLLVGSKKFGRGPLVAILIFGGALVPVMGFNSVYPMRFSWVADHFQYHANFALMALIGAILVRIPIPKRIGQGITALVMIGLGFLSNIHGLTFQNEESLWRNTIKVNPEAWLAHENLGILLKNEGKLDEAIEHFNIALSIIRDPRPMSDLAGAHIRRFVDTQDPRYLEEAELLLQEALEIWPKFGQVHMMLGQIYFFRGPTFRDEMIHEFELTVDSVLSEKFQQTYVLQKIQSETYRFMLTQLFAGYLQKGQDELADGNPRLAYELFSKSVQPYHGPGTILWRDLAPWVSKSPWFNLELHRIWMLGAFADPALRNPEAALQQVEWLMKNAPGLLQRGMQIDGSGTPEDLEAYYVKLLDCQAACLASLGRFRLAIDVSAQAIERARKLNAPPVWLEGVLKRNQLYRQKTAYRFSRQVPTRIQ
jgi:tetratricopeptide (TPR) repeat protein